MTLMQAPRMAATAPQDEQPAARLSVARLKRVLWWLAAAGLLGIAIMLGWGSNEDGPPRDAAQSVGAAASSSSLLDRLTHSRSAPAVPAWSLSIDGAATTPAAPLQTSALRGSAEARLIAIYQSLRSGERAQALLDAQALTNDYPNFQLAQLLYADLLTVSTSTPVDVGSLAPKNSAQAKQLAVLLRESQLRLQALTEVPKPGTLPSNFLALPPSTRNVIAVDASRSRLYWFKNTAPAGKPANMVLVKDVYMSVGKNGVGKFVEGDGRTPLGVYFITSILADEQLPDLYGRGALPLNYPNALDILRKKTGDGIWLHGTPTAQYVRAPLASEGCVVLSNPDITRLLEDADIRSTPVLIAQSLTWVDASRASAPLTAAVSHNDVASSAMPAGFHTSFAQWQYHRQTQNLAALRDAYSDKFFRRGKALSYWWPTIKKEATPQSRQTDITVVSWQDEEQVVVVNYAEQLKPNQASVNKRQYWRLEGNTWRIFYEGNA
jgi:L,D-transpeptidase YnhG